MKAATLGMGLLVIGLAGCYAPMGPLGHRPDLLFRLPVSQRAAAPAKPISGPQLLVPMFSSRVTYPTGAFYNLQRSEFGPLAHTYASKNPEAAFYEGFVDAMRAHGLNALREYDPGRVPLPGESLAFLRGEVHGLEIDSIHPDPESELNEDERTVYDAARVRLSFQLHGQDGRRGKAFAVVAACKLRRGNGDVLRELGARAAIQVDACLRRRSCQPEPPSAASHDTDEPHEDAWAALENLSYGQGARP